MVIAAYPALSIGTYKVELLICQYQFLLGYAGRLAYIITWGYGHCRLISTAGAQSDLFAVFIRLVLSELSNAQHRCNNVCRHPKL